MAKDILIDLNRFTMAIKDIKNKISNRVPITRKINGKALSSDITIGPNDISSSKIVYATCSSEAAVQEKEITLDDDTIILKDGDIIAIKFTNTNSFNCSDANGYITFKIGSDSYSIYENTAKNKRNGNITQYYGKANCYIFYKVDNTNKGLYHFFHSWDSDTTYTNWALGQGYATCSTASDTLAKTVPISSYASSNGGIVAIKFTYSVLANSTLQFNNTTAKSIYYMGEAIKDNVIKAGDVAIFMYNNSYYHLLAIDKTIDRISKLETAILSLGTVVEINKDNWVQSNTVYTNTVSISGINDNAEINVAMYNEAEATQDQINTFDQLITDINVSDGNVIFTASSKPTVTISVILYTHFAKY